MQSHAKTPLQARADKPRAFSPITAKLRMEGKSIPQWARENGFNVRNVQAVIYGHNKGYFGTAAKIAKALGLSTPTE